MEKEILNANVFQNFNSFIRFAKKNNIDITIISHKSKYPILGKKNKSSFKSSSIF